MRLKSEQARSIKQIAKNIFGDDSKVYLFGSRTDDDKKGGDIDLYIETSTKENIYRKKIEMLKELYENFGEQKIDIVLNNFRADLYIYKVARDEGILL
jgi:predicted nucleotidyltransferase